jgi:hypothetical protein
MTTELRRVNKHVEDVEEGLASGTYYGGYRGLGTNEEKDLRQSGEYVERISKVAQQGRAAARQLQGDVAAWESIIADCNEITDHIRTVVETRGNG